MVVEVSAKWLASGERARREAKSSPVAALAGD
jgi:hypothetical protein